MDLPPELVYHCQLQAQLQLKKEVLTELVVRVALTDPDCDLYPLHRSIYSPNFWNRKSRNYIYAGDYKVNWGRAVTNYQSYIGDSRIIPLLNHRSLALKNTQYLSFNLSFTLRSNKHPRPELYYIYHEKGRPNSYTNYWGEPFE